VHRLWDNVPEVAAADRMMFEAALAEIVGDLVEHARTPKASP
jgi:hypothetical protein